MSQNQQILKHLKTGKTLTAIQALKMFDCFRLAARIENLRKMGHDIESRIIKRNGKRYASYKMGGA